MLGIYVPQVIPCLKEMIDFAGRGKKAWISGFVPFFMKICYGNHTKEVSFSDF